MRIQNYYILFLLGGLFFLLAGCSSDINVNNIENQKNQTIQTGDMTEHTIPNLLPPTGEYLTFIDERLGVQLQRPKVWGNLISYQDDGIQQISFRIFDPDKPPYEREITLATLYFVNVDEYDSVSGQPYTNGEMVGHNDKYYFLLWMSVFATDIEKLLSGINLEMIRHYLITSGFTIFPTQEDQTVISSLQQSEEGLVYRDEEHGFQISFPKEFKEMKIYTDYVNVGTFGTPKYDTIMFTLPVSDTKFTNPYLPKEIPSGYEHLLLIFCIPVDTYHSTTDGEFFGGRDDLEYMTLGRNYQYYFVINMGNMVDEARKSLALGRDRTEMLEYLQKTFSSNL